MMRCLLIFFILSCSLYVSGQKTDSLVVNDSGTVIRARTSADTTIKKIDTIRRFSPRKAAIRSAVLPGWGQVYNKKYWKVPLVYAAIGIPAYTFFYNKEWYQKTRDAAVMLSTGDTINYKNRVDSDLHVFFTTPNSINSLLNYRNEFRRNMDYSVLIFLLAWGLNVVDATVDAHLKGFDVSDDLSMKIQPKFDRGPGIAIVLKFK
jgi:hypothetical protein